MTGHERERSIFEMIAASGEATIAHLSRHFQVSEMTIRRDLAALERAGLVKRTHGGVTSAVSLSYEPPFAIRSQQRGDSKQRIGHAAAALIEEGETVILDVGTTTNEVARALKGRRNITVFTPSLHIANTLADEQGIALVVSGGTLRRGERSLVGDLARRAFDGFVFDKFVMGIAGLHPVYGLTEYNTDDAQVKGAALAAARECVVVADSYKIGRIAFARICGIDRVDNLVTDDTAPDKLEELRALGVNVTIAQ